MRWRRWPGTLAGESLALPFEVTDIAALPGIVARAWDWHGGIDLLVNNAGISQRSLAIDTSMDVYRRIMEVDFFAPLALTQLVVPHMAARKVGHIAAVSSVAGESGLAAALGLLRGQARADRLLRRAACRMRTGLRHRRHHHPARIGAHGHRHERAAGRWRSARRVRHQYRQRHGSRRG